MEARQAVALLARQAFRRQGPFRAVEDLGIPAECEGPLCVGLSQEDRSRILKIVYLMRLRRILGYPHGLRDEGLLNAHTQLVQRQQMPEGYSPFEAETGFYTPAQIAKVVKSTEREWFRGSWSLHRVGWTRTLQCGLQIFYSSDVSPRRGWVHTHVGLPQLLRLPLEPSSLFWIDPWKLVQCREPDAFSMRYGLLLRLVCLFADELDRLTAPAAGGGTEPTGDPAGVTDQRES